MFLLFNHIFSEMEAADRSKDSEMQSLRSRIDTYQQREGDRERWPSVKADMETRLAVVESERYGVLYHEKKCLCGCEIPKFYKRK